MRQRIEQDPVLWRQQGRNHRQIRQISRAERNRVRHALEDGELLFHLVMQIDGAGEQPDTAGSGAVLADGVDGGIVDAGVPNQTEVVVGGQHQHLAPLGLNHRA